MKVRTDFESAKNLIAETIGWLSACHHQIQEGLQLQPDPFYKRSELLTPDVVNAVLATMDELFISEFAKYPSYHTTAQGVSASTKLVPPRFSKLSHPQKLAIVQGVDRVFQKYRVEDGS